MCLYIIHFLLTVNHGKMWVQTHFLLLFVNKKYPETYILLWKGGWFWLFTHFANKKPSAAPRAFYCCKMCKKSKSPPFLYYEILIQIFTINFATKWKWQNSVNNHQSHPKFRFSTRLIWGSMKYGWFDIHRRSGSFKLKNF